MDIRPGCLSRRKGRPRGRPGDNAPFDTPFQRGAAGPINEAFHLRLQYGRRPNLTRKRQLLTLVTVVSLGCTACKPQQEPTPQPIRTDTGPQPFCEGHDGVFMRCYGPEEAYEVTVVDTLDPASSQTTASEGGTVTVPFLRTLTTYDYTIETGDSSWTGTFTTTDIGISTVWTVSGTSSLPAIAMAPSCLGGDVILLEPNTGRVMWMARTSPKDGVSTFVHSIRATPEGNGLLIGTSRSDLTKWSFDLTRTPVIEPFQLMPYVPHHDARYGPDGRLYALTANAYRPEEGAGWVVDSLYVEDSDQVDFFDFGLELPLVEPDPFVAGRYWSLNFNHLPDPHHANNIAFAPNGNIVVSLRHINALVEVGSPDHETPGAILRTIIGAPNPAFPDQTGDVYFEGQHSPDFNGNKVALFDNRSSGLSHSHLTVFDYDTLQVEETWDTQRYCVIQGSSVWLENGNILTTCPSAGWVAEWQPGLPDPVWEASLVCGTNDAIGSVPRVVPIYDLSL